MDSGNGVIRIAGMAQRFETRALPVWNDDVLSFRSASEIVLHVHPEDVLPLPVRLRLLREIFPGVSVRIAPSAIPQKRVPQEVYARWDDVHPACKPWLVRKVLLTGPESTGKTTLAHALSARLGYGVVPEYLRDFWQRHGGCAFDDLEGIAAMQIAREYECAQDASRGLLCDTSPLSTLVYAKHYFGRTTPALERWASVARYDVILFLDDDLPWVRDGQRDSPEARTVLKNAFLAALDQQKAPYHVIQGQGEQRVAAALDALRLTFSVL